MADSRIILISSDFNKVNDLRNFADSKEYKLTHYTEQEWVSQKRSSKETLPILEQVDNVVPFRKEWLPSGKKPFNKKMRSLNDIQSDMIREALAVTKGNVSRVSKILRIGRATLYRKIKEYDIDLSNTRHSIDIKKKRAA